MLHVLVVASTFPAHDNDQVPAFVKDQIVAIKKEYPDITFSVLAPHDARSRTLSYTVHECYNEYRFHYMWPFKYEELAGRGIVPALQQKPIRYLLVPFLVIAEFFALLRLTRELKPDIIYAHWFTPQGITAGMVANLTRLPFVYTSHSSDVSILRKIPVVGPRLVRHFTKKAHAITVVSRRSLNKLRAFFNESDWQKFGNKVMIVPMGTPVVTTLKNNHSKLNDYPNILFIGRLAEKKGVQYLLPAFAKLLVKHPAITLTIAGDGPWLAKLQAQANDLHLLKTQVVFCGYISGAAKTQAIAQADILVVPSIITASGDAEGLPVSLMEGLAAGKLCIATNESGADDIIENGKNGYLVPEKDIHALWHALDDALLLGAEQQASMRNNAVKTAKQFAWPAVARRHYVHLFQSFDKNNLSKQ